MSSKNPIAPNPPRWKPKSDPSSIVVPGLDTEASTTDQIEQIEQLITIKLQNIDENFSKIHNVLANKLLPSVKKYAVGTEPVREAAKFWTSFYEQAAQIRIPTFDDYSTVNETPSEHVDNEHSSHQQANTFENAETSQATYQTNGESSFSPSQAAFSSTPASARHININDNLAGQNSAETSWTPSLESPLVRLNREIENFSTGPSIVLESNNGRSTFLQDDASDVTFQQDATALSRSIKGKGKDTSHPLLKNVLRHNLYSASDNSSFENNLTKVTPLKPRNKSQTPAVDKTANSYLRSDRKQRMVDSTVLTPQRNRSKTSSKNMTATPYDGDEDDDSFDALPPGMSPPVLLSPARPPRSSAELGLLKLGQTPARDVTARIQRELLRDAQVKSGGDSRRVHRYPSHVYNTESSISSVPTPPSLSRYKRINEYSSGSSITKDSSLESMIRQIRSEFHQPVSPHPNSIPAMHMQPQTYSSGRLNLATPLYDNQQDMDSDSDSLDEINNTAHPSAAFLMASQGRQNYDDSFGSSNHSSDSLEDEDAANAIVPIHPLANTIEDDGFDDSFEDEGVDGFQEDTVFGIPSAQRTYGRQSNDDGLRMLGEDLLQDTIGIGSQIAASGRNVDESPTPHSWAH